MKKIHKISFLFFAIIMVTQFFALIPAKEAQASGNVYYVSVADGNDTACTGLSSVPYVSGSNQPCPWKTIAKVNASTFGPDDQILFKKGEIWREQLTAPSSGTAGHPIIFGAYGSGAKPIISGADVIASWSAASLSGPVTDVYQSAITNTVTQVFVDGARVNPSRWPKTGYNTISATSGTKKTLTSDNWLTQADNYWAGAKAVIKTSIWRIETETITSSSQSSHSISWTNDTIDTPTKDYGFYIEGALGEISLANEWAYSGGKLYIKLGTGDVPANHVIEAAVRDYGIIIPSRDYVTIDGLGIEKTRQYGVRVIDSAHATVKNNSIINTNGGIVNWNSAANNYLTVTGNIISKSYELEGIVDFNGSYSNISNNNVSDIGTDALSPKGGIGIGAAVWINPGSDHGTISQNYVARTGSNAIYINSNFITVSDNLVSATAMDVGDCGGIYTHGPHLGGVDIVGNNVSNIDANTDGIPLELATGWARQSAVGIYLDEDSSSVNVRNNLVSGVTGDGISLHDIVDTTVINNTIYSTGHDAILVAENKANGVHGNNIIKNNIAYTSGNTYDYIGSTFSAGGQIITSDYNLFYNGPGGKIGFRNGTWAITDYTLASWKTFSGQDANSLSSDPKFTSLGSNFTLQSLSPAIDTGVNQH